MARQSQRIPLTGSALVRCLARLHDGDVPAPTDVGFAERLGGWLGWTEAIALSSALTEAPPPSASPLAARSPGQPASASASTTLSSLGRELVRLRAGLAQAIVRETAALGEPPAPPIDRGAPRVPAHRQAAAARPAVPLAEFDLAECRLLVSTRQQDMAGAVALLRKRLRAAASTASPALARLAAVDAVMEQVVGGRERTLLAGTTAWLDTRLARVRAAAAQAGVVEPPDWLPAFRRDVHDLLVAELDHRLQPLEGLLAALRDDARAAA